MPAASSCISQEPDLHLRKPALFAKCLQLLYCIAEPPLTCELVFSLLQPSNEVYGQLLPHLGSLLVEGLPGGEPCDHSPLALPAWLPLCFVRVHLMHRTHTVCAVVFSDWSVSLAWLPAVICSHRLGSGRFGG